MATDTSAFNSAHLEPPTHTQQLAITAFGEAKTLALQTQPIPKMTSQQVLVAVDFAGVNPIDAKTRAGLGWAAQQNKDNLPWVPGYDIAGQVVAIGEQVTEFAIGDRVSGFIGFPLQGGGYSQYVVAEQQALSHVPENVTLETAAALPLAGQTAWQALEKVKVKAGERVLILAGAGGVGHLAIQLATAKQAQVIATASQANLAFLTELGAHAVDYHQGALVDLIEPVDVLIDLMGGEVGIAALECVKVGGRVVTIPTITADLVCQQAEASGLSACGMLVAPSVVQNNAMLERVAQGQLKVEIAQSFPLNQGAQAHQQIESGRTRGKVLLAVSAP